MHIALKQTLIIYITLIYNIYICREIDEAECDVPVLGIAVPGNFSFLLMVLELVSDKFGTEKSLRTGLKKICTVKILGIGPGKNCIVRILVRKSFGTSLGENLDQIQEQWKKN